MLSIALCLNLNDRSKDILVSQLKDYIVAVLVIKLGALSKKLQPKNRLLMA